jgi:DNA-binding LytR/AlgR family response regulator
MNNSKAIIVDDEKHLRRYLRSMLADVWPELEICGEAQNGEEALALIESHQPHVVFLDIRMQGMCGMQVARQIAETCWVVFITAYDRYAVNAFESGAVDYILKPVTAERLQLTVIRLKVRIAASGRPPLHIADIVRKVITEFPREQKKQFLQWIRVPYKDDIRLVAVDDICFFRAEERYTAVITEKGESLIRKPIRELVDELDPDKFWQIHRATIVNVGRIEKISRSLTGRGLVKLKNHPEILTISRSYLHKFKQM